MQIQINLFGRVAARVGETAFTGFPTRKAAELLMILAVHPDQPMSRRDLITLLWPGTQGGKANNRLSATLYMLRKALETEFGDDIASLVGAGEGSIWLQGDFESQYRQADTAWRSFTSGDDLSTQDRFAQALCQIYRGHLGADMRGAWFEPLQSLWASRWTECILWRTRNDLISLDEAIVELTQIQPILPVTRSLVTVYLNDVGQSELARSWHVDPGRKPVQTSQAVASYRKYGKDDFPVLARRATMTALVVETHVVPLLRELVDQANPTTEWVGNPQIFCARNPLIARRIATRLRQVHPLARIYISTEVADLETREDDRLLGILAGLEPGETMMNAAAAALIDQHDRSVVMERSMGRSEYRLL